ncbi:MAG: tetratricopeptide repeat protein [bacterium]|nr:tetratricopeptide repeat protein [bacterium]
MKRWLLAGCLATVVPVSAGADLQSGLGAMSRSDYATALKELTPLAEAGDPAAQFAVGQICLYGWGVRKNEAVALQWFLKAGEQGHNGAQKVLASMYKYGLGVARNPQEEEAWSRRAKTGEPASVRLARQAPRAAEGGKVLLPNEARAGRSLSRSEAARLEEFLRTSPDDLPVRARLLGYYYSASFREEGAAPTLLARRRQALWIIRNAPGSEIAGMGEALLHPAGNALADKEGYEQAKGLWQKQLDAGKVEPRVLLNAVGFFQLHDKEQAEKVLDKGEALYPQDGSWAPLRGYLYALGILGIDGLSPNGIPVSVNTAEQDGVFAKKARKAVEASTSAVLVGTAGNIIAEYGLMTRAQGLSQRDFSEFAEKCLVRAHAMAPASNVWGAMLVEFYSLKSTAASSPEEKTRWSKKALVQMEKVRRQTSPEERKYQLMRMARVAFNAGAFDTAEKSAKELLDIATAHAGDANYGDAVHDGNMILGRLALQHDDVKQAKVLLLRAGHASAGGAGTLSSFGPNMSLARDLLERGEKDTVIEYLQLCKKFWTYPRNPLDQWIKAIQAGQSPDFARNLNY